jgi:hypothetical protein
MGGWGQPQLISSSLLAVREDHDLQTFKLPSWAGLDLRWWRTRAAAMVRSSVARWRWSAAASSSWRTGLAANDYG